MPIFNVRAPDGSIMKINGPEDATDDELIYIAQQNYKPEPTFGQRVKSAFKEGIEQIPQSIEGIKLGAEAGLGFNESAKKKLAEIKAAQEAPSTGIQGLTFKDLEDTYGKEGALAALKKLPTYVAEQAASNAPSMAAPLAAGEAGAMIGGPLVGLASGIGTYGLQQYGQFMQRQAQGAKDVSQLEPGKAAAAAAATAPLGYFVDRLTAGMSSVPANVLGENILSELAKRAGRSVAGRAATGATLGIVAESPTEVLEQMAERWQAGLPLFDEQAKQEYKEAAAGAAALGGIAGGVGHVLGGQHHVDGAHPLAVQAQVLAVALGHEHLQPRSSKEAGRRRVRVQVPRREALVGDVEKGEQAAGSAQLRQLRPLGGRGVNARGVVRAAVQDYDAALRRRLQVRHHACKVQAHCRRVVVPVRLPLHLLVAEDVLVVAPRRVGDVHHLQRRVSGGRAGQLKTQATRRTLPGRKRAMKAAPRRSDPVPCVTQTRGDKACVSALVRDGVFAKGHKCSGERSAQRPQLPPSPTPCPHAPTAPGR